MQNRRRHLAAILFTDIVGYTAMMQQNEADAVLVMKKYTTVLQKAVSEFNGEIINDYGDGSLCSFLSATDAVNCAIKIQNELREEPSVPLRIGLHIGEIFFEDDKVFGDGVNVASRIQSLGQANTILFSSEINNKIRNNTEFKTVPVGRFEFKNVDEPVEVFALTGYGLVVPKKEEMEGKLKAAKKRSLSKNILIFSSIVILIIAGLFAYKKFFGDQLTNITERTIAILPFKNISINKEENEPFCVGVTLELQKKLEWINGLTIIAPQSMEKYRDTKMSVADIAKELGDIKYFVQGTVQRDKNRIKVFASLIDATNGKQMWHGDFPGDMEDVFSLQEDIAEQIASGLQIKITPEEKDHINRVATKSTAAIDAYNDALTSYVKLTTAIHPLYWDSLPTNPQLYAEYKKTLSLCDQVIAKDPLMAEAYVLKGQTYHYRISQWYADNLIKNLVLDSVGFYSNKALQLDNMSADAYLLASIYKRDSALTFLEKAIAINANNFEINRKLTEYYLHLNSEKAIRYAKKAIRINPLSIWTPDVYRNLGFIYHCFGDFEKAESYGKKAIELAGNSIIGVHSYRNLVITYLHWGKADSVIHYANHEVLKGEKNFYYEIAEAYCNIKNDCAKATQLYEELWNRYNNHSNPHRWAVALINIGKIKEAGEKIDLAVENYKNDTLSYDYAGIWAMKGDKKKAISILKKFRWDWGSPYLIQHDKLFDNIRNEKEFKEIVQKALDEKSRLREKIKRLEERGEL